MATPHHLGGHAGITNTDAATLDYLLERYHITSMLDVGCGPGGMLDLAIERGVSAVGIDGDPAVCEDNRRIIQHDYAMAPLNWHEADLIWCVEFAEHVEQRYEQNWLTTLRCADVLLFSAALPGQCGHHHVNCQTPDYWRARLASEGWAEDTEATAWVRENAVDPYIRNTGMVFTASARINLNPIWNAIDGWLFPEEGNLLTSLAAALPNGAQAVEIGTYRGKSTVALAVGCNTHGAHLTTIDSYEGCPQFLPGEYSSPSIVRSSLIAVGAPLSAVTIVADKSANVAAFWSAPIALLFIDGLHEEEAVRLDIQCWWRHVKVGGKALFHDHVPGHGIGVMNAVRDELIRTGRGQITAQVGMIAVVEKLQ